MSANAHAPRPLDTVILTEGFPMAGVNLIEASAGTGKTYCIQTLYLRMVVERGFPVQEILVVTFTDAATHELRDRLRAILEKCRLHLGERLPKSDGDAERIQAICGLPLRAAREEARPLSAADAGTERRRRVEQALLDFDEAAIHTIHGFCNRVLRRHAFECGQPFDAEMVGKDDAILDEACQDVWRQQVYGAQAAAPPGSFPRSEVITCCMSLSDLRALAGVLLSKPDAVLRPEPEGDAVATLAQMLRDFVAGWNGEQVTQLLSPLKRSNKLKVDEEVAKEVLDRIRKNGTLEAGLWKSLAEFAGSSLKKGDDSAIRPMLMQCKKLGELRQQARGQLAGAAVEVAIQRKARRNQVTYDDLIRNVRAALADKLRGDPLRKVLRAEYLAALIDEFQDTDPVQYDIFRDIFIRGGEHPVFLVGDPKQAIYAFRSGDIFTYYAAAAATPERGQYTLTTNYRAETRLVDAVNAIFKGRFRAEAIRYDGTLEAKGKAAPESLLVDKRIDPQPFRIWYYDTYAVYNRTLGPDSQVFRPVYADIALEIRRLLDDPETTLKERRIKPSDIAVLVQRHVEADLIHRALAALNIKAVRQSTGNVFDSDEAADFHLLLEAIAAPNRLPGLRAALASDLFDLSDAEIFTMMEGGSTCGGLQFQDYVKHFEDARKLWQHGSLIQAFRHVSCECRMRRHLLGLENGERRLTNVLQLLELVHQAAKEHHLGMTGAIEWLARQRQQESREESDAFEGRLESDALAVRIMTLFKSKGLQFPIVFLPTLGLRTPSIKSDHCLHHELRADTTGAKAWDLVLDVGKSEEDKAREEIRQENIRLFYVGATRAEHRTYLIWGRFRNPANDACPLSDVLRSGDTSAGKQSGLDAEKASCASWLKDDGPVSFEAKPIQPRAVPAPAVSGVADALEGSSVIELDSLQTYDQRNRLPLCVDKSHGHASYTGIGPKHPKKSQSLRDFDEPDDPTEDTAGADIFSFPSGAKTGKCWHSIFEQLDYTLVNDDAVPGGAEQARAKIDEVLDLFHLCSGRNEKEIREKKDIVVQMVHHVLTAPLEAGGGSGAQFRLCEVRCADRCEELMFDFPLRRWPAGECSKGWRTGSVLDVLRKHWGQDPERKAFLDALQSWDKEIPQGFMNGSIDLLFRVKERYYVLDWKSNRRNGKPEDFAPDGLREEMASNAYFLQYLIYTVAVHQYLKSGLPGYDYGRNFGGVFYLFMRGVDPAAPGRGIYFDRPSLSLVEDLSATLGEFR